MQKNYEFKSDFKLILVFFIILHTAVHIEMTQIFRPCGMRKKQSGPMSIRVVRLSKSARPLFSISVIQRCNVSATVAIQHFVGTKHNNFKMKKNRSICMNLFNVRQSVEHLPIYKLCE